MAFGQPSGPPATAKQVQLLLSLLQAAGHSDFRDARGPMGFTQRQAAGKFTRVEADAFIEQLERDTDAPVNEGSATDGPNPASTPKRGSTPTPRHAARSSAGASASSSRGALSRTEQALRKVPSPMLAAELQRRGWVVMQP